MNKEHVIINGEKIVFYIKIKEVKNINLKVKIDKKIIVSAPNDIALDEIKYFIKNKYSWIKKQLDYYDTYSEQKEKINFENGETIYLLGKQYKIKMVPNNINYIKINNKYIEIHIKQKYINNKNYIEKIYIKWLKEYALNIIEKCIDKYLIVLNKYGVSVSNIEIRTMKARWGSCNIKSKKILFNTKLIKTPMCCVEYVVLHELCHFKYSNHNEKFYKFITIFMPDWEQRKKILDEEFAGII